MRSLPARNTVDVLDFGADPTGTADSFAAFQLAHDYAKTNGFQRVLWSKGRYKIGATINWSPDVAIATHGDVTVTTDLSTGPLLWVSQAFGNPGATFAKTLFDGKVRFVNSSDANAASLFRFGNLTGPTDPGAWGLTVRGVVCENFRAFAELGFVSFLLRFVTCNAFGSENAAVRANRFGVVQPVTLSNAGENVTFVGCVFHWLAEVVAPMAGPAGSGIYYVFDACSFDYCDHILGDRDSSNLYRFGSCHFEWFGTTTYFLARNCSIRLTDCYVYVPPGANASPLVAQALGTARVEARGLKYNLPNSPRVPLLFRAENPGSIVSVDANPDTLFSYPPDANATAGTGARASTWVDAETANYAPLWTTDGTPPSLGDGVLIGRYTRSGSTVRATIRFVPQPLTTFGSGTFLFALPLPAKNAGHYAIGNAWINDTVGARIYFGQSRINPGSSTVEVWSYDFPGARVGVAVPMAWASGDELEIDVTYEV